MTGLNGGSPVFLTGGFTAGYREAPPTVGWFGGLVCDSFLGGSALTGVAARVGFDMDYDMTGAQFFTELRTGVLMESPSGVTNSSLYFAIHSGVQFLIDF